MRSETFAPRAAVPVPEGQREERREGTLTKQPALFSGFLFLPFVERQRREEIRSGFGNAAAAAAAAPPSRTGASRWDWNATDLETDSGSEVQCRALPAVLNEPWNEGTVLSSSSESSELVSRIEETDKP